MHCDCLLGSVHSDDDSVLALQALLSSVSVQHASKCGVDGWFRMYMSVSASFLDVAAGAAIPHGRSD